MKLWKIEVHHSVCTEDTYYAYAEENPYDKIMEDEELVARLLEDNFTSFSYLDGGPCEEDYETVEEFDEAYDDWYNEYIDAINIECDEYPHEEEIEEYDLIYDERNNG